MEFTSRGPAFQGRGIPSGYVSLSVEAVKDNAEVVRLIETTTAGNGGPTTVVIELTECQVVWLQDELSKYKWSTSVRKNV